jgi:phage terminase small subunit
MRKTDDNIILQMHREGKLNKEIAEYFGVSQPAICKRLKKLLNKKPKSFENLTKKEQNFVLAIAEGNTKTQAALDSYECSSRDSAKSMGYQLIQKPDIQTAVAELMQEEGLTRRFRVQKLRSHINHADPTVSLKALDQSWKLDGAYTEKHVHVHTSYQDMLKAQEITDQRIKAFEEKYGIRFESDDIEEGEIIEDEN